MTTVQIIPGNFTITDGDWPKYNLVRPGQMFTSDDFTGSDSITDAARGGSPFPWDISTPAWVNENGALVHKAVGNRYMELPTKDFRARIGFAARGSVNMPIYLYRDHEDFQNGWIQIMLQPSRLEIRVSESGGTNVSAGATLHDLAAGGYMDIVSKDGVLTVTIGENELSVTLTESQLLALSNNNHFGFGTSGSSISGERIDWIEVTPL